MRQIWVVFAKEFVDNLRDRRSLTSSLLTPLLTPLLLIGLMIVLGQTLFQDPQEKPLSLAVVGADRAPNLVAFLQGNNVILQPAPADPQVAVREGDLDLVLIIPEGYAQAMQQGEPAPLQVVMDSSRQSTLRSTQRLKELLSSYSRMIGILKLQARGVDPRIINGLSVEDIDTSTPQSQTLIFLNMLPFLMIMTIFVGGMSVIIDGTAGERERGSLEPLLINPVPRWKLVIAKLLASLPFSLATLVLSLTFFGVAFNYGPLEELVGLPLALDVGALQAVFWLSLPMVLLAAAASMVVATFTRSYKEAQTYLSLLPLVAGFPSAFLAFLPIKITTAILLIPIFSQSVLINKLLRQEIVLPGQVAVATISTLLVTAVAVFAAIRLFEREHVLVGR
jgi:sodium transport system permease protein